MIIINNINLPLEFDFSDLKQVAGKQLKVSQNLIKTASLYRKSVDARKKDDVHFCCSLLVELVCDEGKAVQRCKKAQIFKTEEYTPPMPIKDSRMRPVVVGFGPAGMFAALTLARAGLKPIVIERGEPVEKRTKTVERFMNGGSLDCESNVQFGEGGAGTFSDGKLNTGIKNVRCRAVLKELVRFGADEKILTDAKPHVGTDRLVEIVKNLRNEVISLGGEVVFSCRLDGFIIENSKLCGIKITKNGNKETLRCDSVILAIGHSARDTFEMLKKSNIPMERKPFSVGARIEHRREDIDKALYGEFAGHPALGAADYKLSVHLENGRGVYTFCMCPGGEVINASSEAGATAVNGMSYSSRDGVNSNSAVLADIRPDELEGDDVLAGMYIQREIEKKAYDVGNGAVPVQSFGSLIGGNNEVGTVSPTVKPNTVLANMHDVLPSNIADSLVLGIQQFGKKIKGFDSPDALLTFPETRSSSPVRILRGENGCSAVYGLYPAGEGAGYAGGIMSAAVDGIKAAEMLIENLR